ncbi:MAG: prephenate dehydrogenase [Alphaproteobacteria bacterium]
MKTGIIGLGLIGGSFSYALKKHDLTDEVIGFDIEQDNVLQALQMGFIDKSASLDEIFKNSDLIVIATPVNYISEIVMNALDNIKDTAVVIDMGSTKESICKSISKHNNKSRFVATHPMWGTEHSGPQAAQKEAFSGRTVIICDKENSDADALDLVESIYKKIGMDVIYLNSAEHDTHVAYVSHISHISSFALSLTTLAKTNKEDNYIKELASSGFASTVRLAKSSPNTWSSIFVDNKENVLDVLDEYIDQINLLRRMIRKEQITELKAQMTKANAIKEIIDK